jgi:DNA polymerase-3 subunit epsilon
MSQRKTKKAYPPPDRDPILVFADVETTGLSSYRNGVWQVSFCLVDTRFEKDTWFDMRVKPFPEDEWDDKAIELSGITPAEAKSFSDPIGTYHQILNIFSEHVDRYNYMDKMTFLGWNAEFDESMLREWWKKCDDKEGIFFGSWFHMPVIDVAGLTHLVLMRDRLKREGPENFQLGTVAKYLGIEVDEECLHDSLYDVELTREIYNVVTRRMKGV